MKAENYLLLDKDYAPENKYSPEQVEQMEQTWSNMKDEYFRIKNSVEGKNLLRQSEEKIKIVLRIENLQEIYNSFVLLIQFSDVLPEDNVIRKKQELHALIKDCSPKYKGNMFASIGEMMSDIESMLKSANNMYNEKNRVIEKKIQKEETNIYRIAAMLSKSLGIHLNIKEMTVTEFIAYEDIAMEIQKANGKQ